MARNATSDLSRELGTQVELEDLHPKTFLRKHLLSEADEAAIRKPLQDAYRDVQGVTDSFKSTFDDSPVPESQPQSVTQHTESPARETPARAGSQQYDDDAT
jgi:sec-independent protein translocase protein TatB